MAMLRASEVVVHISVAVVCIANLYGGPSVRATGDSMPYTPIFTSNLIKFVI
jgi:hypothetical protein